ncbi:MAG: heme exporter protein CcmB [Polyangiaceae bacterium]|nr:heme exporter protein CcmB [Polyangiaceae bacterium]
MASALSSENQSPRNPPGWLGQAWLVFEKDYQIEKLSGELTISSAFFAVLVVVLASITFHGDAARSRDIASGVIWLSLAFSTVLALGKSWAREREGGALQGLMSSPLRASALFAGKVLGLILFLASIEAIVVPLVALFFRLELFDILAPILLLSVFALPGIAGAGTLFGAMTVKTGARELALAIVLFPLLAPVLLAAVAGTHAIIGGAQAQELFSYLQLIFVFDLAFLSCGLALFGSLLED